MFASTVWNSQICATEMAWIRMPEASDKISQFLMSSENLKAKGRIFSDIFLSL